MTVELHPLAGTSNRFEAWADGAKIGLVVLATTGSVATMAASLDVGPLLADDIVDLIRTTVERAKEDRAAVIEFSGESLVLRQAARQLGFGGGLRGPLTLNIKDTAWPVVIDDRVQRFDRHERLAWLVATIREMGVTSTPARPNRAFGRLSKRLVGGVGDTLEVIVEWAPGRTFIINVPDRPDLMPEAVALAGDTATAVLNRFAEQAHAVRFVYFDRATYGFKTGRESGMTQDVAPSIHLNVGFVAVEESLALMRTRDARPVRSGSARPPPPFTELDATVAHELWHKIENVFEAQHYRSSIDFRRRLGLHLGVETLEHAVKGGSTTAPAPWRHAHRRLVNEVSPYATTNRREATAEMFKLWWCGGDSASPIVARFGELVDQFLPLT